MKKVLLLIVAAVLALSVVSCGGKAKKDKIIIKLAFSQSNTVPLYKGFEEWARLVKERTNGNVEIQIFPSLQLGNDEDVIEQAIQGAPIAVLTDAARMGNYVKDMGILMMGFFTDNYDEALKVTESESFAKWEQELAEKNDIRVIAFNFYDGPRDFYTHKPINVPADLKGQRIRTIGSPVCIESIQALGAIPVAMSWGEAYNAVQSKALEGVEVQATSAFSTRIYEIEEYLTKTDHFQLINGIIMGEKFFKTIPPEYQQIIIDSAKEAAANNAALVIKISAENEAAMEQAGLKIVRPDLAPFKAAVEKAYTKMGFTQLRNRIYKEIGKTK
ncbi:MAG: C4-dicarboxylate TRAP transporter substrate-binding protein [Elusimicrobiota bacterium]|nr:C4-dicarboxylate TRAP transporter substrate-binding protein [Elusimicrobiota bacterium]